MKKCLLSILATGLIITAGCGKQETGDTSTPDQEKSSSGSDAVEKNKNKAGTANKSSPLQKQISSASVVIEKYEIKAGNSDTKKIQQGLQAIADRLSTIVQTARKSAPKLRGTFSGTLHIEANGTVRMFTEETSKIMDAGDNQIISSLVGAIFGKKVKFPEVEDNLLIQISVRIEKSK